MHGAQRARHRTADLHRRTHVGGCDELHALEADGGLDSLVEITEPDDHGERNSRPRAPSTADTGPVLALQNVYLKDCSYESPNGPRVEGNWNPQINLDLQTTSTASGPRCARWCSR